MDNAEKQNIGYVSVHRCIQKHWVWNDKPFSKGQAWIDLLMMVNHTDNKIPLGNELILVERGSRITSVRQLCERWGWSNTKVSNFLKMLQNDGMITQKSDTKKTLITIENYTFYQDTQKQKTTTKRHKNDTRATREHTNNNDNKENNIYTQEFEEFYKQYPNPKEKQRTFLNWKAAIKFHTAEELIRAARNYKDEVKGREKQFMKTSANFLGKEKLYLDFIGEAKPKLVQREVIIEEVDRL